MFSNDRFQKAQWLQELRRTESSGNRPPLQHPFHIGKVFHPAQEALCWRHNISKWAQLNLATTAQRLCLRSTYFWHIWQMLITSSAPKAKVISAPFNWKKAFFSLSMRVVNILRQPPPKHLTPFLWHIRHITSAGIIGFQDIHCITKFN